MFSSFCQQASTASTCLLIPLICSKVYELIGSRWVDQGTAFCFGQFQEETNEALLIARSEVNYQEIILSTAIRSNDVYQRQQGVFNV